MMRSYSKKIDRVMRMIPEGVFECIPGCSDCCQQFPCSWTEWDRVADKRVAQYSVGPCPYIRKGGGCDIYEDRPIICRIYGLVTEELPNIPRIGTVRLRCKRGLLPKVKLPKKLLRDIFMGMVDVMNREAADILNLGGHPYPAGPYGYWILRDIRDKTAEHINA